MCLKGPTISPVYTLNQGSSCTGAEAAAAERGFYAATICVPKARLYTSVKDLRDVSCSLSKRFLLLLQIDLFQLLLSVPNLVFECAESCYSLHISSKRIDLGVVGISGASHL